MYWLLMITDMFTFAVQKVMMRFFQTNYQKEKYSINLFQAVFSGLAAVIYTVVGLSQGVSFGTHMIFYAAMFGLCYAFATIFAAACMEIGSMSLSTVIINLSMILPVAFSWIMTDDPVTLNAVIGIALTVITLFLSSKGDDEDNSKNPVRYFIFMAIAFIANGFVAIFQKQYKLTNGENDMMLFTALAFIVASVIFFITYLIKYNKNKKPIRKQISKLAPSSGLALIAAIGCFSGNGLLGYLCDRVNGGILYPCVYGGFCLVIAASSFVIFKEKITKRKIIALITGMLAIIILNL